MRHRLLILALLLGGCATTPDVTSMGSGIDGIVKIAEECWGKVTLKAGIHNENAQASVLCEWIRTDEVY